MSEIMSITESFIIHVTQDREAMIERARIQEKRVAELEALVKEFISCVENPGAQEVFDEGYVDLVYAYEEACYIMGITPQAYQEAEAEEIEHDTDGAYFVWMGLPPGE